MKAEPAADAEPTPDPGPTHESEASRSRDPVLSGILNATGESIWLFGVDGTALAGNRTAFERFGRPAHEIIGRRLLDYLPADLAASRGARLREAADSRSPVTFEDARGDIQFEHTFWPILEADGTVERVAIFSRDITDRRRMEDALRRSEERFRALAGNARDAIARFDREGRFVYANPFVWRSFATCEEDVLGKTVAELGRNDGTENWEALLGRVFASGAASSFDRRSVEGRWYNVTLSPETRDGEVVTVLSIARDVTDRRRAEDALREANRELADADRNKNEFLAMLSHELRNPLTPIRNSLALIAESEPGSERARRAFAVIERQTAQLARLVDDLLDVTRVSHNKIQLRTRALDLNDLASRVVEDHRAQFEAKGILVEERLHSEALAIEGDGARLIQAISNLLENAAKFTPDGGKVTIETEPAEGEALLKVTDTGAGIAAPMLRRLFQPFMQADATLDRTEGGLGLGLALVRGLVELHGGTVEARSAGTGKGAAFTVRLPLTSQPRPAAEPQSVARAPGRRVLVIEDNVDAAESLKELLGVDGHEVETACTGPEGLAKARSFSPEVIFCDIGLPDMDGYEVARALRADPSMSAVTLIAMTGYALPEDVRRAREAGFDRHLAKPAPIETLRSYLAALA